MSRSRAEADVTWVITLAFLLVAFVVALACLILVIIVLLMLIDRMTGGPRGPRSAGGARKRV